MECGSAKRDSLADGAAGVMPRPPRAGLPSSTGSGRRRVLEPVDETIDQRKPDLLIRTDVGVDPTLLGHEKIAQGERVGGNQAVVEVTVMAARVAVNPQEVAQLACRVVEAEAVTERRNLVLQFVLDDAALQIREREDLLEIPEFAHLVGQECATGHQRQRMERLQVDRLVREHMGTLGLTIHARGQIARRVRFDRLAALVPQPLKTPRATVGTKLRNDRFMRFRSLLSLTEMGEALAAFAPTRALACR